MKDALLERYLRQVGAGEPVDLSPDELTELKSRYPFFSQPAASALRSGEGLTKEEVEMLRSELALSSADIKDVEELLGSLAGSPAFYPPEEGRQPLTTESTIDAFLERYGNPLDNQREISTLEKLIFNPVAPDYAMSLEADEEAREAREAAVAIQPTDSSDIVTAVQAYTDRADMIPSSGSSPIPAASRQDRLIDAFLSSHKETSGAEDATDSDSLAPATREPVSMTTGTLAGPASAVPGAGETPDRKALLSESLAKIFIKRGKYDKAFEIIHSLSLNYPEKSVYFADQLRFLHKAIQISKRREAAQKP